VNISNNIIDGHSGSINALSTSYINNSGCPTSYKIASNTITNNYEAMGISDVSYTLFDDTTIENSDISGIRLYQSPNNIFSNNRIINSSYGIRDDSVSLSEAINNTVFYNNYLKNNINVYMANPYNTNNTWYHSSYAGTNILGGSMIGGNFYGNATGNGYSQTCIGGVFCTTPYSTTGVYDLYTLRGEAYCDNTSSFYVCRMRYNGAIYDYETWGTLDMALEDIALIGVRHSGAFRIKVYLPDTNYAPEWYFSTGLNITNGDNVRLLFLQDSFPVGEYTVAIQTESGGVWSDEDTITFTVSSLYGDSESDYIHWGKQAYQEDDSMSIYSNHLSSAYSVIIYDPSQVLDYYTECDGSESMGCQQGIWEFSAGQASLGQQKSFFTPCTSIYTVDNPDVDPNCDYIAKAGLWTVKMYDSTHTEIASDTTTYMAGNAIQGTAKVHGTVTLSGTPVQGIPVYLSGLSLPVYTNATGGYHFYNIGEGYHSVRVPKSTAGLYKETINSTYFSEYDDKVLDLPLDNTQNFVDLGSEISQVFVGRMDADNDGEYSDDELKGVGIAVFGTLLLIALIVLIYGTWGMITGKHVEGSQALQELFDKLKRKP